MEKVITAIIADCPIICEAAVIRAAIPKIYATSDEEAIELDDYICELECKTRDFQTELAKQLKQYYQLFMNLRSEIALQNDLIKKLGGTPIRVTQYYELDEKELFRAPQRSMIQC